MWGYISCHFSTTGWKEVVVKVDTKLVGPDKYFGTFRVRRVCDDSTIVAMFELPNYDADDESTPLKDETFNVTKFLPSGLGGSISNKLHLTNIKKESLIVIDFLTKKESEVTSLEDIVADVDIAKQNVNELHQNTTVTEEFAEDLDILINSPVKEIQNFCQLSFGIPHVPQKVLIVMSEEVPNLKVVEVGRLRGISILILTALLTPRTCVVTRC
ncbi:hypothetical protein HN873_012483 [Arachis hypogaea]